MKATTIREAMEMECFPEFLEGLNGHRPAFQDKHVELLLKDDGSRRRVEGLKTNEFANMHLVVLWKNVDFVDCFVQSGGGNGNVVFENCQFNGGQWHQSLEISARFINCQFRNANFIFQTCNTVSCRFSNCTIRLAGNAIWRDIESVVEVSRVTDGRIVDGGFVLTQFSGCELRATHWANIKFHRTSFSDCAFQSETKFVQCDWDSVHIDRVFLESLGPDRGGINDPTIRGHFTVHDPITELRLAFGGWRRFIHVATMFLFLAPYVGFTIRKMVENWLLWKSQPEWLPTPRTDVLRDSLVGLKERIETEWLLTSLMRFAFLDGEDHISWQSFVSVVTVFIFATYNMARIVLLIKSREIEHMHEIQGIWPKFNLTEAVFAGLAAYASGIDEKLRRLPLLRWPRLQKLQMWVSSFIQALVPRIAVISEKLDWLTWQVLMSFVGGVAVLALCSAGWHFLKLLTTEVPVALTF